MTNKPTQGLPESYRLGIHVTQKCPHCADLERRLEVARVGLKVIMNMVPQCLCNVAAAKTIAGHVLAELDAGPDGCGE